MLIYWKWHSATFCFQLNMGFLDADELNLITEGAVNPTHKTK